MRDSKHSQLTNRIYLIIALILLVGLIGCSPSSEENTNTPSENDIASESEDVVITFSSDESYSSIIEPLIEVFHEENPSITVQYLPISADASNEISTVEDRLLMLASSADTTLTAVRSAYTGSYFLDLQPLIDADGSFDQADFWNGTLSGMEDLQGRITGLPITFFLQGIFYDKSAFVAANLSYPQPGWTWDDFRSAAATLAQDERYGYADRASASILRPLVGYQLAMNDGEINAETLTTELEWYLQMTNADQILALRSSDELWRSQFTSDSPPAMWTGSLFDLALGSVTGEPEATDLMTLFSDSTYGFASFPVDTDGEQMNTTPITALYGAISRGSEHPQESWKWLKFLSAHWLISNTSDALNLLHIPARLSVAEAEGFWDNYPPEVRDAMQYGLAHAWFASLYSRAESAVLNAVQKVTVVNSSLLSALEDVEVKQASWPQENPDVPEIIIAPPLPSERTALGVEKIDLYYISYSAQVDAAIAALVRQFNQDHKDEIVVQTGTTLPDTGENYFVQIANNFDCFLAQLAQPDASWAASSGPVLNLTPLMEAEDAAFQHDFDPRLLDIAEYDGDLYGLPISTQPRIMAYNADLLAELGLEPPSPDWSFDEFLALITAVSSSSGSEPVYGSILYSYEMYFAGRGVQWWDTSGDFPVAMLDTSEMLDATNWLADLVESGVIAHVAYGDSVGWYELSVTMDSGNIGFWRTDAGDQEYIFNDRARFNVGIVPLPHTDKPNGSYVSNSKTGFYISNQTEHTEACWELGKYISERVEVLYGVPARTSVANSVAWEAYVGAENAEIYRAAIASNLTDGESDPFELRLRSYIYTWLEEATYNILIFGNDPAQELAQVQQYADVFLACMAPYEGSNLDRYEWADIGQGCAAQADPNW